MNCEIFRNRFNTSSRIKIIQKSNILLNINAKVIDTDFDLIVGWKDIKKQPGILQDLLDKPTITGQKRSEPIEVSMRMHLLAAIRKSLHVSELLTGVGDEVDDISEQFEHDAPWDLEINPGTNSKSDEDNSLEGMISQMDIKGDETFVKNVKDLFRKYPSVLATTVDKIPAKVTPFTINVDKTKWYSPEK